MTANKLPEADLLEIADTVARRYRKRGVVSVSYADMYQEACMYALRAQATYDPTDDRGCTLYSYCYIAAERRMGQYITRSISPVTSRSNSKMRELSACKRGASTEVQPATTNGVQMLEDCHRRAKVAERVAELLPEDLQAALPILCGAVDPKDLVTEQRSRRDVKNMLQRAKRRLSGDMVLYRIAQHEHTDPSFQNRTA